MTSALLGAQVLGGCGPIVVSGGPARSTHQLEPASLSNGMRPLIQDEPAAVERLDRVDRAASRSTIFLYSGLGALAGCLLFSNSAANQKPVSSSTTSLVIGTCSLSIALEVVAVILAPTNSDYGDVLHTYNRQRPATPWFAPRLGVDPPTR